MRVREGWPGHAVTWTCCRNEAWGRPREMSQSLSTPHPRNWVGNQLTPIVYSLQREIVIHIECTIYGALMSWRSSVSIFLNYLKHHLSSLWWCVCVTIIHTHASCICWKSSITVSWLGVRAFQLPLPWLPWHWLPGSFGYRVGGPGWGKLTGKTWYQ